MDGRMSVRTCCGVNDPPISRAKIRDLDNIRKKMAARVHGRVLTALLLIPNAVRGRSECDTYYITPVIYRNVVQ